MSNQSLVSQVAGMPPPGARVRRWTLCVSNRSRHHGVVSLRESPLFLDFSWRPIAGANVAHVGLFRLDLHGLLLGSYIRHDPIGTSGQKVRVQIVRNANGEFYIQASNNRPRIRLA